MPPYIWSSTPCLKIRCQFYDLISVILSPWNLVWPHPSSFPYCEVVWTQRQKGWTHDHDFFLFIFPSFCHDGLGARDSTLLGCFGLTLKINHAAIADYSSSTHSLIFGVPNVLIIDSHGTDFVVAKRRTYYIQV